MGEGGGLTIVNIEFVKIASGERVIPSNDESANFRRFRVILVTVEKLPAGLGGMDSSSPTSIWGDRGLSYAKLSQIQRL